MMEILAIANGALTAALVASVFKISKFKKDFKALQKEMGDISSMAEENSIALQGYSEMSKGHCELYAFDSDTLPYDGIHGSYDVSLLPANWKQRCQPYRITIKRFPYIIGDGEDKDFARREAEELIETIKNA